MLTGDLASQLGLSVDVLLRAARAVEVEKRCGRFWWTAETIEFLKQELERLAEGRKLKALYPRTAEVASRLGVREDDLRRLIHQHGLLVEKNKGGKVYQWTEEVIASAKALLDDLASRPPKPEVPRPSGLTSKELAARLRIEYASLLAFARATQESGILLQPVRYKGALYWREEDVLILEEALQKTLARPDLRQAREARAQRTRLARLRAHAEALADAIDEDEDLPVGEMEEHVTQILTLCGEIEEASTLSLTFISTLPAEGWTLRHPISVWVRKVTAGFEAVPVDFDLRTVGKTRKGAVQLLRHALCSKHQELALDSSQDAATWSALQQLFVPAG